MQGVKSQLLGDFVSELYSLDSLDNCFNLYEKYVQSLEFDAATYCFIPTIHLQTNLQRAPIFKKTESFSSDFVDHYATERLDQHDFTIKAIKNDLLIPMDWKENEKQKGLSEEEEHVIILAREDYGIENAISIPTMNQEIGMAGASVISTAKDGQFELLKQENLETLKLITKAFHDVTIHQPSSDIVRSFVIPLLVDLKPKEIIILRYLASGRHLKNINFFTDMSPSYASNLLAELRQRLGGITKDKLMYLVGLLNILDHL